MCVDGALLNMTFEVLERVRLFVAGHRQKSLIAASNARGNGYRMVALEHENEAALAAVILKDLANERTDGLTRKENIR